MNKYFVFFLFYYLILCVFFFFFLMQSTHYVSVPLFDSDESDEDEHRTVQRAFKWSKEQFNGCYTKIYDFTVCIILCMDWIVDILTLVVLFQLENIFYVKYKLVKYVALSAAIISLSLLSNIANCIISLCIKSDVDVDINHISFELSKLFPPIRFVKELIDVYSTKTVKERIFKMKNKPLILQNDQTKYSWFQLWVQDRFIAHRLQLIHCIVQSLPHSILLYILILNNKQIIS
eukprot:31940_1